MKRVVFLSTLCWILVLSIYSCKKEVEYTPDSFPDKSEIRLQFNSIWGKTTFENKKTYIDSVHKDTITPKVTKFYISNISLKQSDGNVWYNPNGYFLIDLDRPETQNILLSEVPNGLYTEISYMVGVDSLRNVSGAQKGALSTFYGMFWTWNSGYIMQKFEGDSKKAPNKKYEFHLGGYYGPFAANGINTHTLAKTEFGIYGKEYVLKIDIDFKSFFERSEGLANYSSEMDVNASSASKSEQFRAAFKYIGIE